MLSPVIPVIYNMNNIILCAAIKIDHISDTGFAVVMAPEKSNYNVLWHSESMKYECSLIDCYRHLNYGGAYKYGCFSRLCYRCQAMCSS